MTAQIVPLAGVKRYGLPRDRGEPLRIPKHFIKQLKAAGRWEQAVAEARGLGFTGIKKTRKL